jgi:penicillin-binding protein 2
VTDRSRLRLVVLSVLVVSLVATLLGRLWYLQVAEGATYRAAASQNQVRDIVTQPPRGDVVDDMGRPLIDNIYALVVSVDGHTLSSQADGGVAVLARLARLLGTSVTALQEKIRPCGPAQGQPCYPGSPYEPVPVAQLKPTLANTRQAMQIREEKEHYPGVTVALTAVRHYPKPDGALASALLGYISPISQTALDKLSAGQQAVQANSQVGATGLEASYEKYLHGVPGVQQVAVDHVGKVTGTLQDTVAAAGDTVVTNLDAKVQATLEKQIGVAIRTARASGKTADYAAGVVMNARTGGIVAMASDPTYQPNHAPPTLTDAQYKQLEHAPGHPLVDKAFQSTNPPGSTFKLISTSGLVTDGTASINSAYPCPSEFGGKRNFEGESGGTISLHATIVQSCDTVFYRLGLQDWARDQKLVAQHKKPVEGVQRIARAFGVSEDPKIDIPNAASGNIEDRSSAKALWKQIRSQYCKGAKNPTFSAQHRLDDQAYCTSGYVFEGGDQENEDIGQGAVLMSPLQLAVAYSALANGGTVYEPRLAKAIVSPSGQLVKRIKAPVRDHLPVSKATLDYIRGAMYGVVSETTGTGHGVYAGFPLGKVLVGGKTGTAELSGTSQDGSWFVSFAGPAGGKPEYVTVIEIDKADQGAVSAAPSTKVMWDAIYGLQGQQAIFPNGAAPTALPKLTAVTGSAAAGTTRPSAGSTATTSPATSRGSP